ncbi:MAG: FecR family protein, partial [Allomuricauda sp.]
NGEEIIYTAADGKIAKSNIVYNYLTTARGEQFQITLADGTQVWLNSETQLKYPVSFIDGASRQVELVYGEAYFDVSSSTNHSGSNFKVYHKEQEVQVLGTEFNIKAYKDETNIYTTLVEGAVAVNYLENKQVLQPEQQSNYDLVSNSMMVTTIDIYNETSWKEGVFSFKKKSLKEIMKVLARWYDIEVEFENREAENAEFIGVLGKGQSIEEILSNIKSFEIINNYEINNKKVILK